MPLPLKTQYAKSGRAHIAYQVLGEGPLDLVLVHGWISHLELLWEQPAAARSLRRLASFSRLILFDKRGTGLSDPVPVDQLPTLEQRMDDVRAVMDATGSERAALMGTSEGGPMNLLFAATYPKRTAALILVGSYARLSAASDYPWGTPTEVSDKLLDRIDKEWGTGVMLGALAASHKDDPQLLEWWARYQRQAASPGAAVALLRMSYDSDVRSILSAIQDPDPHPASSAGPYDASRARPLPGAAHRRCPLRRAARLRPPSPGWAMPDAVLDELEEFLTGSARAARETDRVLATVLFTDIAGSTERPAAELGDRRWREATRRPRPRPPAARSPGRTTAASSRAPRPTASSPASTAPAAPCAPRRR